MIMAEEDSELLLPVLVAFISHLKNSCSLQLQFAVPLLKTEQPLCSLSLCVLCVGCGLDVVQSSILLCFCGVHKKNTRRKSVRVTAVWSVELYCNRENWRRGRVSF